MLSAGVETRKETHASACRQAASCCLRMCALQFQSEQLSQPTLSGGGLRERERWSRALWDPCLGHWATKATSPLEDQSLFLGPTRSRVHRWGISATCSNATRLSCPCSNTSQDDIELLSAWIEECAIQTKQKLLWSSLLFLLSIYRELTESQIACALQT